MRYPGLTVPQTHSARRFPRPSDRAWRSGVPTRPSPVGDGPGSVVPVRLDAKAAAEGITTRSEAIRAAIREWTSIA
ncbi:CopG family transcriptional regulator [Acidipropionibacterium jensenii]|nr:CopG family transcriptional regulator [Acidipropionibacterium jensenii]